MQKALPPSFHFQSVALGGREDCHAIRQHWSRVLDFCGLNYNLLITKHLQLLVIKY